MQATSIASRAARWSAKHRKAAILGWIAFVIAAVVHRRRHRHETPGRRGPRATASRAAPTRSSPAVPDDADETVLVQSKTATRPAIRSFSRRPRRRGAPRRRRTSPTSSRRSAGAGQISEDGQLGAGRVRARAAPTTRRGGPRRGAARRGRRGAGAHPEFCDRAVRRRERRQGARRGVRGGLPEGRVLSLPITLLILVVAFGALVAAGVPLLLACTAVAATLGLLGADQPAGPGGRGDRRRSSCSSAWRSASTTRCSTCAASARSARPARGERGRARDRRRDLRPRGADLRPDRDDRDGGHVPDRRRRRSSSFAIGTILVVAVAVLGSLTVLPAVLSKLGDRVEKGRVPFIGRLRGGDGESRVWVGDPRPRAAPSAGLGSSAGGSCSRWRSRRCDDTKNRASEGLPQDLRRDADLRPIQEAFPGKPIPAVVVVEADDVTTPAVRRDRRPARAGGRDRPDERPVSRRGQPRRTVARRDPDGRQRHRRASIARSRPCART